MPPNAMQHVTNQAAFQAMIAMVAAILFTIVGSWLFVLIRLVANLPLLPRVHKTRVPWGPFSVLAVGFTYFFLQNAVVVVYLLYKAARNPGFHLKLQSMSFQDMMLLTTVNNLAAFVIVPVLLFLTSRARASDLGLVSKDSLKDIVRGVLGCFLLLPLIYLVMGLALLIWKPTSHPLQNMIVANPSMKVAVLAYISAVVAAPATEELLFRGVLLAWLWKLGTRLKRAPSPWSELGVTDLAEGPEFIPIEVDSAGTPYESTAPAVSFSQEYMAPAVAISPQTEPTMVLEETPRRWVMVLANVAASALFAGLHFAQWPAPLPLFVLAMGMGYLYQRTGSLLAPIALHAVFNGLSTTLMFLSATAFQGAQAP